jgi:hypothetical protein
MALLSTSTMPSAPPMYLAYKVLLHKCLLLHTGILNLFGGVLIQKKRAEQALEASGMRYTIVR